MLKKRFPNLILKTILLILIVASICLPALPQIVVHAQTTYDVGIKYVSGTDANNSGYTRINKTNPLNDNATITRVGLKVTSAVTGLKVGLFRVVSGNNLTCVASSTVGDLAAGWHTITGLSLAGQTGDYIGIYFATGYVSRNTSEGSGYWYLSGDQMSCTDTTFTATNGAFTAWGDAGEALSFYVDDEGNDTNVGSLASPFLTINRAIYECMPGDTINVREGTYVGKVLFDRGGYSGSYITLQNYTGESPIISGTGLNLNPYSQADADHTFSNLWSHGLVKIKNQDYIKIDGFEIYDADVIGSPAVAIVAFTDESCNYITIQNCEIHKAGRGGIQTDFSDNGVFSNITVDNCEIYDTNYIYNSGEMLTFSEVTTGEIKNCLVHESYLTGGTCTNDSGTCTMNGLPSPQGLSTGDNTITVTGTGTFDVTIPSTCTATVTSGTATISGSPVALSPGTTSITATSTGTFIINVTNGYRQQGIDVKDDSSGILVHDNEVYSASVGIYLDTSDNSEVYNNIIHDISNASMGIMLGNERDVAGTITFDVYNNIIYDCPMFFGTNSADSSDGSWSITCNFINNTMYNWTEGGLGAIALMNEAVAYSDWVIRNNIIMDTQAGYAVNLLYWQNDYSSEVTIDHNSFYNSGGVHANTRIGTDYLTDHPNPLMDDPANQDFDLQGESPCINAGSATLAPATDYNGTTRVGDIDIGALEFSTVPVVTTQAGSSVMSTTATGNGTIVSDGGSACTERGICYSSSTNPPTTSDSKAYESGSFSTGAFTEALSSLSTATTYYLRAYAINIGGTGYGTTVTILTRPATPTNVAATDGTHTDKVTITWTKSTGATDYHVFRGSTDLGAAGDVATFDDTDALTAPTITAGTITASDGTSLTHVVLTSSGASANNGTTFTYTVVASNATGNSPTSTGNDGYRGVGTLTYQWQRSAADSDADYSNIVGATTSPYNDTGAPADGSHRYYKLVLNATGATQTTTAVNSGYRGYVASGDDISDSSQKAYTNINLMIPMAFIVGLIGLMYTLMSKSSGVGLILALVIMTIVIYVFYAFFPGIYSEIMGIFGS